MASPASGTETRSPSINISEEWSNAACTIVYNSITSPPPVSLICGFRNSGKSTFSRHLVNILLQRYKRVAYLDTDVGQTEFTPPGCLSLNVLEKITPDLTIPCLKTPVRCFFYGDISAKRDPKTYLLYIFSLYDYYRKEFCSSTTNDNLGNAELPLVVNTSGWVKGIGYDVLVDMLRYISPTHVVKINIFSERKNLPAGAFWLDDGDCLMGNVIEVNSACQDSSKRSDLVQKDASLLRDFRLMAYFKQCFPSDMNITMIKELAHALAAHPPYEISISSVNIKHLHCQVPNAELFYSLNATIVGLGVCPDGSEDLPLCVGLGIVRGVDIVKRLLYIITPVPHDVLEKVDVLLQGFIQIPTRLLQVQGCISPYVASNVLPVN